MCIGLGWQGDNDVEGTSGWEIAGVVANGADEVGGLHGEGAEDEGEFVGSVWASGVGRGSHRDEHEVTGYPKACWVLLGRKHEVLAGVIEVSCGFADEFPVDKESVAGIVLEARCPNPQFSQCIPFPFHVPGDSVDAECTA